MSEETSTHPQYFRTRDRPPTKADEVRGFVLGWYSDYGDDPDRWKWSDCQGEYVRKNPDEIPFWSHQLPRPPVEEYAEENAFDEALTAEGLRHLNPNYIPRLRALWDAAKAFYAKEGK